MILPLWVPLGKAEFSPFFGKEIAMEFYFFNAAATATLIFLTIGPPFFLGSFRKSYQEENGGTPIWWTASVAACAVLEVIIGATAIVLEAWVVVGFTLFFLFYTLLWIVLDRQFRSEEKRRRQLQDD